MARTGAIVGASRGALASIGATSLVVALLGGIVGCGGAGAGSAVPAGAQPGVETVVGTGERRELGVLAPLVKGAELLSASEGDADFGDARATRVELADGATSVAGPGARMDAGRLTITASGRYVLSGSLADGQVAVDAPGAEVRIVLDGANVSCAGGAALYVADAGRLTVTLAAGTTSRLACASTFAKTEDDVDAAVFSHDSLVFDGEGTLEVEAGEGNGIVSKDELAIFGGRIGVVCAGNALEANDWIALAGGEVTLACGGDALHADSDDEELGLVYLGGGALAITRANDGVHASGSVQVDGGSLSARVADDALHSDADLQIAGGSVTVTASHEGLEAATVTITGGKLSLAATDDGINATGMAGAAETDGSDEDAADPSAVITIAGGTLAIDSAGDGIDSNGDIVMRGGTVAISAGASGADNTALDYVGSAIVEGGTIIACGRADGALSFGGGSAQSSALVRLDGAQTGTVTLDDAAGNLLASFEPTRAYESVVVSAPELSAGGSYVLSCGDVACELLF